MRGSKLHAMEITLPVLDEILNGDLSPWKNQKLTEKEYEERFDNLEEVKTDFQFKYGFYFPRYSNQKTRYYDRLIREQINLEVSRIVGLIERDKNPLIISWWLDEALNQCLRSRLVEVGEMIRYHGCLVEYLDPHSKESKDCPEMAANCFVIRELGRAYAKIYLEVQKYYADLLARKMSPEDLYSLYIKEKYDPASIPLISPPAEPAPAVNGHETREKNKKKEEPPSLHSFFYIDFYVRGDNLKNAWISLSKNGLIAAETHLADFKQIFSGKVVENPVKWTGFTSDLYYFVLLVHAKYKLIRNLKRNIWEVTCKCFVRDDGSPFDRHEFPKLQRPKVNRAFVESAVYLLT